MFDDQVVVGYDVSLCISRTTRVNLEVWFLDIPSGKHTKNYWTSPFLMGKSAISMAIFNSKLLVYQRVWFGCTWMGYSDLQDFGISWRWWRDDCGVMEGSILFAQWFGWSWRWFLLMWMNLPNWREEFIGWLGWFMSEEATQVNKPRLYPQQRGSKVWQQGNTCIEFQPWWWVTHLSLVCVCFIYMFHLVAWSLFLWSKCKQMHHTWHGWHGAL